MFVLSVNPVQVSKKHENQCTCEMHVALVLKHMNTEHFFSSKSFPVFLIPGTIMQAIVFPLQTRKVTIKTLTKRGAGGGCCMKTVQSEQ